MVSLEIKGLDVLARRLKALPEKVQRVALVKGVKRAAEPIRDRARSLVHPVSGLLARRIEVRFFRRGAQRVSAEVGVINIRGKARVKALGRATKQLGRIATGADIDPYYAKWVEFGHDIVRRGASAATTKRLRVKGGGVGGVIGHVAARPFLRPAFDQNKNIAIDRIAEAIAEELNKAATL